MSARSLEIRVRRQQPCFGDGVELWLFRRDFAIIEKEDQGIVPPGGIIMVELGKDKVVPAGVSVRPTADLSHDDAQLLMDGLWDCGLRPVGAAGSAGQLEAVGSHLQDMRTLVFRRPVTDVGKMS